MSAFDVIINDGFSADSVVTGIAAGDLSDVWKQQDENDKVLVARWKAILAKPDLTPEQRLIAERELARFQGADNYPTTGNAQLFVDVAATKATELTRKAVGSLFDEFLPLTLAVIGLVAFGIFVRFYPGPGKA